MAATFTEEFVEVAGSQIHLMKGGSGDPLLILHGAGGNPGWIRYVQELADHYTVYIPSHPGYGQSERPDWLETMNDMACFYTWFMEKQGLDGSRAIGFSMGGWLAAEIVASCQHSFSKLMLVDPAGIKPERGEIADIFIISPAQIQEMLFHDPKQVPEYDQLFGQEPTPEQVQIAEQNREMAVRICWKPYMHDPRLPFLLGRVNIPTQIVWGHQDQLVPLECGEMFRDAIPGAKLSVIDKCGHLPNIEKPEEFIKIALDFLA
ncbi:MAG TPA: alpha/beta hydrolase [Dehalococcoidia bacterium]|jgi:pimeloyl-ACP methyl ester carboxylesterase|nr:alpha/beta hydrolase [Dehalococcoidia bacterium]